MKYVKLHHILLVLHTLGTALVHSSLLFHHRAFHNSIVAGNYLYIDGGEITTWNGSGDGLGGEWPTYLNPGPGDIVTLPNNFTYSVDLSSPWTNETVILRQISKDVMTIPSLNSESIWLDATGGSFYVYNGGISFAVPQGWLPKPENNALWQFVPNGKGLGNWKSISFSPGSNFTFLTQTMNGISTSGGGLGFVAGGYENWQTSANSPTTGSWYSPPGMVVYNSSSQEWSNVSIDAISVYGTAQIGAAHFVSTFGPEGLLFLLGGLAPSGNSGSDLTRTAFQLNNLSIYEPVSQTWRSQQTTGDAPSDLTANCAVGVKGDDGTYEIFVYGGSDISETPTVSDIVDRGVVHVLSLPSFHWWKEDITPKYGRTQHSCNIIGNRQMVVVGGNVVALNVSSNKDLRADPWPQGIGIFDLSAMEWSDSYDPSASDYVTPQIIKSYLANNNRYPPWSDSTVQDWFTQKNVAATSISSANKDDGKSNTGAIAGGVVGGIVALSLVAGVIWFLMRRKRKTRAPHEIKFEPSRGAKLGRPAELESKLGSAYETEAFDRPKTPSDGSRHELDGG